MTLPTALQPRLLCLLCLFCLGLVPGRLSRQALAQQDLIIDDGQPVPEEELDQQVDIMVLDEVDLLAHDPQTNYLCRYAAAQAALARRVCELSEAQERELKKIDLKWITKQMQAPEEGNQQGVLGGIARFLGAAHPAVNRRQQDPQATIRRVRSQIDEQVLQVLNEEQQPLLERERELRDKFRRQSIAKALVAALDERLYLEAEQRTALATELADWLAKDKELYWQFYFQNSGYIPDVPTKLLQAHLTKSQLSALTGVQRWSYAAEQMEWQVVGQQDGVAIIDR